MSDEAVFDKNGKRLEAEQFVTVACVVHGIDPIRGAVILRVADYSDMQPVFECRGQAVEIVE